MSGARARRTGLHAPNPSPGYIGALHPLHYSKLHLNCGPWRMSPRRQTHKHRGFLEEGKLQSRRLAEHIPNTYLHSTANSDDERGTASTDIQRTFCACSPTFVQRSQNCEHRRHFPQTNGKYLRRRFTPSSSQPPSSAPLLGRRYCHSSARRPETKDDLGCGGRVWR